MFLLANSFIDCKALHTFETDSAPLKSDYDDGDENCIDGGGDDDDDREQCFLKLPGLTTLLCGKHRELIQTLNQ